MIGVHHGSCAVAGRWMLYTKMLSLQEDIRPARTGDGGRWPSLDGIGQGEACHRNTGGSHLNFFFKKLIELGRSHGQIVETKNSCKNSFRWSRFHRQHL